METTKMRESKGGTFSTSDFKLIKKALISYKDEVIMSDIEAEEKENELSAIANLLHRLGRLS
jgi:hypothetical protein